MRLTTVDRELARLAPPADPGAVHAIRARVMEAVAADRGAPAAPSDEDHIVPPAAAAKRRRIVLRVGVAASLVAASVAGITLWPDPTGTWVPAAYAGWRAVPEPVTPGDAQVQASRCRDLARTADPVGNAYGALPVDQLTPVISERRGTWTFTLLVAGARGSHTESALTSLLSDDPRASGNLGGSHGPEVVPALVELEVAVPRLTPALR